MDCDRVRELLVHFVDGDLDGAQQLAVEEHIGSCYLCQEELEEVRSLGAACRGVLAHPAPVNRFQQIQGILSRRAFLPDLAQWRRARRRRCIREIATRLAAAAAVILAVGALVWPLVESVRPLSSLREVATNHNGTGVSSKPPSYRGPFLEWRGSIEREFRRLDGVPENLSDKVQG